MTTPHIRDFRDQRVHMIGIGGSSMSGLAQMLLDQGYHITGSDNGGAAGGRGRAGFHRP